MFPELPGQKWIWITLVLAVTIPAIAQVDSTAATHLGKGYEALKQDRYDAAVEEFRAALQQDPKLTLRARFPLAVALFELKRFDEAGKELQTVQRETGEHPNVLYYLGRIDLEQRNFADAVANLRKAAAQPPFPDTHYFLGYAYFKQGDLPSAEKWLEQAAQAMPRDARVQYQLGQLYRRQDREQDAQKALARSEDLRQRDDTESKLRLQCAQRLAQGPREEARKICDQLYDENSADKLTELGTLYGQHGELEAALKPLQRAAELAPQSPQMQYNLALVYFQLNRFQDARAALADSAKRWPDLFQVVSLYGATLFKLGESEEAHQTLRHAQELNPSDAATGDLLYLSALGVARKNQSAKQYADALKFFQEAASIKPQEPAPHRGMAEVYSLTGRSEQAAKEQAEAERLGGG
jgi:protein O-GlcNAc transferase